MPELKQTFQGGKMEKDIDERIVPNSQYREALNIGVATSEDSDVGAAQNILGNIKTFSYLLTPDYEGTMLFFPAALRHCVYPFYNTDEPRISISGNIALVST